LLYPQNDPEFHAIASVSIALAGLLMIPFAGYIRKRLRYVSPIATDIGALVFGAGAICLSLAALIVSHPYRGNATFPRLHEILARSSAFALGVGMLVLAFPSLRRQPLISAIFGSRGVAPEWPSSRSVGQV